MKHNITTFSLLNKFYLYLGSGVRTSFLKFYPIALICYWVFYYVTLNMLKHLLYTHPVTTMCVLMYLPWVLFIIIWKFI